MTAGIPRVDGKGGLSKESPIQSSRTETLPTASPGLACGVLAPLRVVPHGVECKQLSCCLHDCMHASVCCGQHSGAHQPTFGHLNLCWRRLPPMATSLSACSAEAFSRNFLLENT
ncbi:TPA: hypothetical protein ACH3X3_010795 [Trebouxia sp. C0006]